MSLPGKQQLYKMEEVCEILSLGESSVRKLITDGHLPAGRKIPGQTGVRWFRQDIEDFLARMRFGPPADQGEENSQ